MVNIFTDHAALLSQIDKALRFSESRYRRLFESAQDGILLLNAVTGQIEDVNPFLIKLLDYTHEEFLGKKLWEIGAFKDTALSKESFIELQEKRFIRYDDLPLVAKDGARFSVEFVSNVYDCDGIDVIQCNIRDNTKRHLSEIALRATTRALKILSESNVALLNAETETILIAEYCRIAVETGGYRMAWVGLADDGHDKNIKILSQLGHDDGYLKLFKMTWSDNELGNNPTGKALRSGQVRFVEHCRRSFDETLAQRGFETRLQVMHRSPFSASQQDVGLSNALRPDE